MAVNNLFVNMGMINKFAFKSDNPPARMIKKGVSNFLFRH